MRCRRQNCVFVVPRVLGLSPVDARRVLRNDGFRATVEADDNVVDRLPRVIRQIPAPHADRHSPYVTIFVSARRP